MIVPAVRARALTGALALLLLAPLARGAPVAAQVDETAASQPGAPLVYHQITDLVDWQTGLGWPVLSADGATAVFVAAPGSGDPAIPNRIFVVNVGAEARDDDTGPRVLRVQAEIETADGLRHATAIEIGPLIVVAT